MSYLDNPSKSPPFLEISQQTLQLLQQAHPNSIDLQNVLTLCTTLTKTSDFVHHGKRLENISWRVANRNLLLKHNFSKSDFQSLLKVSLNLPNSQFPQRSPRPTTSSTTTPKAPTSVTKGTNQSNFTTSKQNTQYNPHVDPPVPTYEVSAHDPPPLPRSKSVITVQQRELKEITTELSSTTDEDLDEDCWAYNKNSSRMAPYLNLQLTIQ
ncbi:unnamed protein product [Ambrosiozyma monospora]|uniref:Unnamed protein product n=1 Tax=Ambrosiozyma monospora TaxID=43982 RepID=A0ACB5SRC2_AMBMO|nr:unnamed protein product [Ambrosiozyma monospora]